MFIYLPIIIGVFSLYFLNSNRKKSERNLFVFIVVVLTIVTGLRNTTIFPDMANYESYFFTREFDVFYMSTESVNIGYTWLNNIFHWTNSFQVFVFAVTVLVFLAFSRSIYEYSPFLILSLFLFILDDYPQSCFLLRQYLAMATILFSIPFIINRQLVKFLACMTIALSFHTSALVFLPVYFLYNTNVTKRSKTRLYVSLGVAALLGSAVLVFISGYMTATYSSYITSGGLGSYARLAMKAFLLFVYFYALGQNVWERGINQIVLICMFMAVIVCYLGISVFIFFRMRMYFSISEIVGIPIIIQYNRGNNPTKKFVVNMMMLAYVVMLAISYNTMIVENLPSYSFEFFWQ